MVDLENGLGTLVSFRTSDVKDIINRHAIANAVPESASSDNDEEIGGQAEFGKSGQSAKATQR